VSGKRQSFEIAPLTRLLASDRPKNAKPLIWNCKHGSKLRRADVIAAQEFHQIQRFAAACRRQWPGAMIVLRPDGAPTGADAPPNQYPRTGKDLIMDREFNDHDTPSEADVELCYRSKFISASELGDKKIRTRILKVKKEPLRGQDGKEKNKFILSFSNLDKSLVANATNVKTHIDSLGKAPSGWLNADVGIFTEATMMGGKPTRGVRLRVLGKPPAAAPAPKPPASALPATDAAPWPDESGYPGPASDFVDLGEKLQ
jgi:hypothetical protein